MLGLKVYSLVECLDYCYFLLFSVDALVGLTLGGRCLVWLNFGGLRD